MSDKNIERAVAELEAAERHGEISFEVKDDFVKQLPDILSNIEAVKDWAIATTQHDKTLILETDEDFENAKTRCADINRIIKAIDGKRKEVKDEYNKPFKVFEDKLKEVTEILNQARDNLWSQVKSAEETVKREKELKLEGIWAIINNPACGLEWSKIFNPKWVNKGVRFAAVEDELRQIYQTAVNDQNAIAALGGEFTAVLLNYYKEGHTLSEVIAYNTRLANEKKALEEKVNASAPTPAPVKEEPKAVDEGIEEPVITKDFRVWATLSQFRQLKEFFTVNNIKYGRVPKGEE